MRTLLLLLSALTLSGCCCGSCGRKAENFVTDAPTTTDDARKRAKPPDVTVEVVRITKSAGSGGACHSAVCLIILPVLVFQAVFPEKYDLVTVKERGVETFSGTYSTGGALMSGVVHLEGGEQKQIVVLSLDALDKSAIVEAARLKPGAPDGGFTRVPTTLQSQHDFLSDYRKALEAEKKDTKRGELLGEALQWLDVEALPMLIERLKDPAEPDRSKSAVLRAVCEVHDLTPSPHEPALLAAAGQTLGPFSASAALHCADDDGRRAALLSQVVTGACAEKDSSRFAELNKLAIGASNRKPQLMASVSKAAKACPPMQAALFGLQLHEEVDRAGLSQVLQSTHVAAALELLSFDNPIHRGAYFDALGSGEQTERLLGELADLTLTPDELGQLTRAYLADRIFFSRDSTRASVLRAMKRYSAGVDAGPARKLLLDARAAASGGDRPVYEVALLVLGDRTRTEAALKGAGYPKDEHRGITSQGDLVNFGLELAGCTRSGKGPFACPR